MKFKWREALWITAAIFMVAGLFSLLIYFKIEENRNNESEKPKKGWVKFEDCDSVNMIGVDSVSREDWVCFY